MPDRIDTFETMQVFAQVAETGSFSRAAERLGISKALASKYVARLEDRLGVRLVNRTTRQVSLTDVGSAYAAQCQNIIDQVKDLETAVQARQQEPSGHLRVSGPRVFGEDVLVRQVRDFRRQHPNVTIDLVLEERLVDVVAEGFDLAVRIGELTDSSLIARKLSDYQYVLCAAPTYLARNGEPQTPAELADHRCIINTQLAPTDKWELVDHGRTRSVSLRPVIRVNSGRPVRDFVLAGEGIGMCLLPTVREDFDAGRLVRLLAAHEPYWRSVSVVYPHRRHLSAKVRTFVDHLVAYSRDWY